MRDARLEPAGAGEMPGIGGALVLPVLFTAGAWAVDRFTRSGLGDWRYLPTAVLGLCALYFTILAVIVIALNVAGIEGSREPGPMARAVNLLVASKTLFAVVLAAAIGVLLVQAVRDRSVADAVTAVLLATWARFNTGSAATRAMPRARRRIIAASGLILPLWVLAILIFHLH